MAEQICAKEYSMWDLMSGDFIFNIPDYQRPYSWTENEAVTLWDDLVDFWNGNDVSKEQSYFVGSIVLVKSDDSPEAEVIDGQQRLTTISLMLSILLKRSKKLDNDIRKCLWEEGIQHKGIPGRPRLTLRKRDAVFFEKYVAKNNIDELLTADGKHMADDAQRLLQGNAKALSYKIEAFCEENGDSAIDTLLKILFNQCFFVVVTTPDNESAFRVFSVMNNRGLSLLPSDIVKAHIIGEISEEKRQYYTEKWEDIEVELGREAFNALLSHIRMIYGKNKLHGTLVSEFERYVFAENENRGDIITEIIEPYAMAYKEITKCEYINSVGVEEVNELLNWLNRVDDSDWVPPVMYIIAKFRNEGLFVAEFIRKIERLSAFCYLTSKTSNQRIERYGKIIDALQNESKEAALGLVDLTEAEQKQFMDVLDGDVYLLPARKRTYIILRLDRFLSDCAAQYKNSIFSIEHVLPQNPSPNSKWMEIWADEKSREYWTHKISNLIPLTRKKNSQAQNFDFVEKKNKYFSDKNGVSSYALTIDVISAKEWTPISVAERQKRLLGIFAKYWELLIAEKQNGYHIKTEEKPVIDEAVANGEKVLQNKIFAELDKFFLANPTSTLPRLPEVNVKVGEYVRTACHKLFSSEYKLTDKQVDKLCSVDDSKHYTRRNLSFLLPVERDNTENELKRYWKTEGYIEIIYGKKYYVYSQWYPDHKQGKDAHLSDFLRLYLDIALGKF